MNFCTKCGGSLSYATSYSFCEKCDLQLPEKSKENNIILCMGCGELEVDIRWGYCSSCALSDGHINKLILIEKPSGRFSLAYRGNIISKSVRVVQKRINNVDKVSITFNKDDFEIIRMPQIPKEEKEKIFTIYARFNSEASMRSVIKFLRRFTVYACTHTPNYEVFADNIKKPDLSKISEKIYEHNCKKFSITEL